MTESLKVLCVPPPTTTPSIMHDYQREKIHGMSNSQMPPSKGHVLLFGKSKLRKISMGGKKSGIKLPQST